MGDGDTVSVSQLIHVFTFYTSFPKQPKLVSFSQGCFMAVICMLCYCGHHVIVTLIWQKVDAKKLEKAEQKLQQKLEKRLDIATTTKAAPPVKLQSATASQVLP